MKETFSLVHFHYGQLEKNATVYNKLNDKFEIITDTLPAKDFNISIEKFPHFYTTESGHNLPDNLDPINFVVFEPTRPNIGDRVINFFCENKRLVNKIFIYKGNSSDDIIELEDEKGCIIQNTSFYLDRAKKVILSHNEILQSIIINKTTREEKKISLDYIHEVIFDPYVQGIINLDIDVNLTLDITNPIVNPNYNKPSKINGNFIFYTF